MAHIVITGANRGIGLALTRLFAERGDSVVVACRKSSAELRALKVEVHEDVEITDDNSVERFAAAIGEAPVDILVNNAAIRVPDSLRDMDLRQIRAQLEVNAIGPLRVITSRSGSIGDNGSGGDYGYRMSKAAVNMAGVNLALELKPKGISVVLLHPGMVRTGMGGGSGAIEPEVSARRLVARIDELSLDTTGSFLHAEGRVLPW